MTGKELKEFAARVHDDATIEFADYSLWSELKANKIRAMHVVVPTPGPFEAGPLQAVAE